MIIERLGTMYSPPADATMNYPAMPKVKGFKSSILKFLELNCFYLTRIKKSLVAVWGQKFIVEVGNSRIVIFLETN